VLQQVGARPRAFRIERIAVVLQLLAARWIAEIDDDCQLRSLPAEDDRSERVLHILGWFEFGVADELPELRFDCAVSRAWLHAAILVRRRFRVMHELCQVWRGSETTWLAGRGDLWFARPYENRDREASTAAGQRLDLHDLACALAR
jgi:hypothetical protein